MIVEIIAGDLITLRTTYRACNTPEGKQFLSAGIIQCIEDLWGDGRIERAVTIRITGDN